MANESKFKISQNISYPSHLDSFEKKSSPEFGKAVGDVIYSEWFHTGTGRCRFYTGRAVFQERRIYANGLVNMEKYYDKLGTNGDVSLLNLSKKSLSRMPKIVDLVVNGMSNRKYSIVAKAIDPVSQDNKQAYRKRIESDQNTLPIIQQAKEASGLDIAAMPIDQIPETKEELDLHLQMEWKPSNCLSNQLAIATVMAENEYDLVIKRQIERDLVIDGIGCNFTRLNPAKGIIQKRIDGAYLVYSTTKDPYFRDCFYKGHVEQVLISDICIEYPELLNFENTEVKKEIESSGASWSQLHGLSKSNNLKGTTNLLYFTYKTFRERASKVKKKANGEVIIDDAKDYFDASKPIDKKDRYTRNSVVEEVLFEGVMVLGTNILLKWELAKSMSRPKSNTRKVCEQYNIVAPNFQDGIISSLVSRMMPIDDKINVKDLKVEQIIQGITPDGIAIDVDALAAIDLGDGKTQTVQQSLNMYLQKGSYLYRSSQIGGEYNQAQKPFQEVQTGDSINKLVALRNEINNDLIELTDVVGLNKATDASTPDRDSLVGIQKMAAYTSNLATKHILDASGYLTLKSAETISYCISDILKYYPSLRDDLISKIGATAVEDLDYVKDLHLSDFAIFFELEMDDEERAMLDADLSLAIEKGFIGLDDKYKIRDIKILKLAIQYLSILIKKRAKITQEQKAQEAKQKSDMDIRTSQQSNIFAQETIKTQMDADAVKQKAIQDGEIAKEKERTKGLLLVEELKGKNSIELQLLVNSGAIQKNEAIEDKKDERELKADTRESRKIEQRQKEGSPIDFESEEADMKMFNIES
jgi:hypothetical protein